MPLVNSFIDDESWESGEKPVLKLTKRFKGNGGKDKVETKQAGISTFFALHKDK